MQRAVWRASAEFEELGAQSFDLAFFEHLQQEPRRKTQMDDGHGIIDQHEPLQCFVPFLVVRRGG